MVAKQIGVIIQARVNSVRLPGKILLPLPYGSPTSLLEQIILRAKAIRDEITVILATSVQAENAVLKTIAAAHQVAYFSGPEDDVLERFYQAAAAHKLDIIIRLTADNPFIDPAIIAQTLLQHVSDSFDYTSTAGLPLGTNIEIFNFSALQTAARAARAAPHREHVTPYLRLNPQLFKNNQVAFTDPAFGQETWRLTVDNENDYALACLLYQQLSQSDSLFTLPQTAAFIYYNPWVLYINKNNFQKKIFPDLAAEITEAIALLSRHDLPRAAALLAQPLS